MSSMFQYSQDNFDIYKASFRKRYPDAIPGILEQIVNVVIVSNPPSVVDGIALAHMIEGIYLLGKIQPPVLSNFNSSTIGIRDCGQTSSSDWNGKTEPFKQ